MLSFYVQKDWLAGMIFLIYQKVEQLTIISYDEQNTTRLDCWRNFL